MAQRTPHAPIFPEASAIPTSWLYESFRLANEREDQAGPLIKLHVGEPAFGPPESVGRALAEAVLDGRTRYIDVQGLLELREAISEKLATCNGIDAPPDRLFVTPGSCQGLVALLRTLAEPGAEILIPEIHWPVHLQQALLAGLRPVFYGLDDSLAPDVESVRAESGPNTRILLLNSPSNPTGALLTREAQTRLYELASERGWQIVSDEAYEDFAFAAEHMSIASLERGVAASQRLVNSVFTFSKGLAMTGYRLGYVAVARPKVCDAMRMVQESSIIAPSAPIQYAGLSALKAQESIAGNHAFVRANRDRVLPALTEAGLLPALPGGGWYAMVDISASGMTGEEFAAELLRSEDVAVVPGGGFSARPEFGADGTLRPLRPGGVAGGLVRIAFCADREQLALGVERIVALVEQKRKEMH
ncbi:pyridoxal phosphate-dependent aminotransferase [Streptomyces sp. HC44]|uniref:Pyridoxal phosphate-dependent aminotransferase n=1 Tax=Streptomyces scabichelini TaxID=2711217 RepID=A0A6G4V1J0_9ACTN|nr:pyridoxal phosphate-dependent aminotransferase [Streptomyces scabichelini]NGO07866.1 pyridoxal phosphate-dependent aminotransferase [Streptomyces scabichelini]